MFPEFIDNERRSFMNDRVEENDIFDEKERTVEISCYFTFSISIFFLFYWCSRRSWSFERWMIYWKCCKKRRIASFAANFFCLSGAESIVAPNLLPFQKTIWNFDNKFVRTWNQSSFNRFKSQRQKGFSTAKSLLKSTLLFLSYNL